KAQAAIAACSVLGRSGAGLDALIERKKREVAQHPNGAVKMIEDVVAVINNPAEPINAWGSAKIGGGLSTASARQGRTIGASGIEWGREIGPRETIQVIVNVAPDTGETRVHATDLDKL